MAKKQSTKQRTRVKDLPAAETKLTAMAMKKVKGGGGADVNGDGRVEFTTKNPKLKPKGISGDVFEGTGI